MVDETNKYAKQFQNNLPSTFKIHKQAWRFVTRDEMTTFFGILHIMDVFQVPEIRLYWSNSDNYANACKKKQ